MKNTDRTWLIEAAPGRIVALSTAQYSRWLTEQDAKHRLRTAGSSTGIHQEDDMENDDAIDSYEPHVAKLRAANETTASTFEEDWKKKRTRELAAEHAEIDASSAAAPWPRLTAAELEEIPDPPDPYASGLDKLRGAR